MTIKVWSMKEEYEPPENTKKSLYSSGSPQRFAIHLILEGWRHERQGLGK